MRAVPLVLVFLALGLVTVLPCAHALDARVDARALTATSVRAAPVADVTDLLEAVEWSRVTRDASIAPDASAEEDARVTPADAAGEPLTRATWTREDAARAAAVGPGLWLAVTALGRVLGAGAASGLGLLPGYARITRADVLENDHRERVFALLRERPGLSASDLQTITGYGWGTVTYHLDRLQRTGLVTSERSGLSRRYYPAAEVAPQDRKAMAALERPQLSALAKHVLTSPGLAQGELAAMAGLSKSAAAKQLAALEAAGLVEREREGRVARVKPTDALVTLTA